MTKYKCGHKCDTIIMNSNVLSLSNYFSWKDTDGFDGDKSQCYDCYCDEMVKQKEEKK